MTQPYYTHAQVLAACRHYAPEYQVVYDNKSEGFYLPQWIPKAILAAWMKSETTGPECKVLRDAWRDLSTKGKFMFAEDQPKAGPGGLELIERMRERAPLAKYDPALETHETGLET